MTPLQITAQVQLEDLLNTATTLQMTPEQTIEFVGTAIEFVRTKSKRVFDYTDPVDAAQPPQCRATFVRSFVHADWIDGESVVQAETTTLEEGFNSRFHKLEKDLDALAADIAKAFVCLGDQRAEVSRAFEEVKTEINRINSDVFECCGDKTGGTFFPFTPISTAVNVNPNVAANPVGQWGQWVPVGPFNPNLGFSTGTLVNTGNTVNPNLVFSTEGAVTPANAFRGVAQGSPWSGATVDPVRNFIDTVSGANALSAANTSLMRSTADPSLGVVAGMPARLIEESSFNGNPVDVWSTAAGLVLTPRTAAAPPEARATWINPRVDSTGQFASWAAGKAEAVTEALGAEFTVAAFTEKFGEEKLESGIRVADLLAPLAGDTKAATPLDLVAPLAESSAREIIREGFASETVIGAVGLNPGPATVADAPVETLKSVDKAVVDQIVKMGIATVGELAAAAPAEVAKKLARARIKIGVEQVAAIAAEAATVVAVDRSSRDRSLRPGRIGG